MGPGIIWYCSKINKITKTQKYALLMWVYVNTEYEEQFTDSYDQRCFPSGKSLYLVNKINSIQTITSI